MSTDIEAKCNLWQKINKAKELVGVVKKNGKVEFKSTKYNYQTAEDIDMACRDAFIDAGLVVLPTGFEVINDVNGIITTIQTYKVIDIDTGEAEVVQMGGMGQDAGDKRIYKAETGAYKYLLKQLLQIPSEDTDPDKIPTGAWDNPKPKSDGSVEWKDYVFKTGTLAGKTLGEAIKTNIGAVRWYAGKQGESQPYCQAALESISNG